MKKFAEKIVEGLLKLSGALSSLTIMLIVVFLFKEGAGLFSKSTVEDGYQLLVNKSNTVTKLNAAEIKSIYDAEITDWKEFGSNSGEIMTMRIDDILDAFSEVELGADYEFLPEKIAEAVSENPNILICVPTQYIPKMGDCKVVETGTIGVGDFFGGHDWFPTASPAPLFGTLPLLLGTLLVSLMAILIATPIGVAVAIYLAELASPTMHRIVKPVIELLSGIPSIVYGFFGLVVIVPLIQQLFGLPVGETGLAGAIVLAIMTLPTIITVGEDAIRSTPKAMKEAALGLGANHWQTIYKVILPYSVSGLAAAVVLGIGRAVGETMAVLMVTGNAAVITGNLLEPCRTIPATIAAELGETSAGSAHYQSLFLLGCILFIITLAISITAEYITSKQIKGR